MRKLIIVIVAVLSIILIAIPPTASTGSVHRKETAVDTVLRVTRHNNQLLKDNNAMLHKMIDNEVH